MQLEDGFEVPAPPDAVWDYLLDVERVAPCMPGATLTEVVDDDTWKGQVTVALGPVKLTYKGKITVKERDEAQRRVILHASGQETRGKGTATATVESRIEAAEGGSTVRIVTDLTLSGAAAQYGRGMIGDVSKRMTGEFARCLSANLQPSGEAAAGEGVAAPAGPTEAAREVSGIRLGIWALWRALLRLLRITPKDPAGR